MRTNIRDFDATVEAQAIHTGEERLIKVIVRVAGSGPSPTVMIGGPSVDPVADGFELVLDVSVTVDDQHTPQAHFVAEAVRTFELAQWVTGIRLRGDFSARTPVTELG